MQQPVVYSAWQRGMQARSVALAPSQHANSARRNPRTVIQQQLRGHPSRPVWWTGRRGGKEVLKGEFTQARRGRDRAGFLPSGQVRRQEQEP